MAKKPQQMRFFPLVPLPKIDRVVDATAGHTLLSSMDANAGYHQIALPLED